ncbi:MAG: hypothetical protein GY719_41900, partial [bacterium]|nr:hypothetical protein [bacterium]
INSLAAQKLNLPGPFVEGKDLRQVLFSSLFEAESLFERIRSGEQIENVEIEGKHFPDGKEDLETITIRSMIISCYPAVSEFDDSSLVVVVLS